MRKSILSLALVLIVLSASNANANDETPRGVIVDYGTSPSALAAKAGLAKSSTVWEALAALPALAPIKDTSMIEVFELPAGSSWTTDEVLAYLATTKVRPANIQECLTLAGSYGQELGRGGLCLGQRLDRDPEYGIRYLDVQPYSGKLFGWAEFPLGGIWGPGTRFYYVRK